MRKIKKLFFIPILFSLFSCGNSNENLPTRKDGNTCNVSFFGNYVDAIDCPSTIAINQELSFSLNIAYKKDTETTWRKTPKSYEDGVLKKPNVEYNVHLEDIHVFIGGKEYKDSFEFFYINNALNKFIIKKEYVVNDIQILISAEPRGRLCLYGYQFSKSLDERIDYTEHDDPRILDEGDIAISFASKYQDVRYPIRTLSGQPAFPVFENDDIDLTIRVKDESAIPLPDNIWYRCNARYATLGIDFTREYSEPIIVDGVEVGWRTCRIKVPKFFIHDHGSFAPYGEK